MVSYSKDKKYAFLDGVRYCLDEKQGYYRSPQGRLLHRAVYEKTHNVIPKGYQVHHVDHDKGNNEPENLVLLTVKEHRQLHAEEMTDDLRERLRENMLSTAIPAAAKWHKSEAGAEWHKNQYKRTKESLQKMQTFRCKFCGKEYEAIETGQNAFCSGACKSAMRRKMGLNKEKRICAVCGGEFFTDKYKHALCCSRSCANRLRARSRRIE